MLNNQLDTSALRDAFAGAGRVLVRDALQADVADQLLATLENDIPWQMAYMEKGVPCTFSRARLAAMPPAEWEAIQKKITALGRTGFQFCYGHYSVSDRNHEQCLPAAFINAFSEYLRSDAFLQFAREVSGNDEICRLEILAARYQGGDFLMKHDDTQKPERRVAFVFNLSRDWLADWGGLTHFLAPDESVVQTYVPTWNSLLLFSVPALHMVSSVMPFAPRPRYSVTGWLTV